jgi:hypothetical protein
LKAMQTPPTHSTPDMPKPARPSGYPDPRR